MEKAIIALLLSVGISSCSFFDRSGNETALARVGDKYLLRSDIEDLYSKLSGDKDSLEILSNYVNNWVQQELLYDKAELNLSEEQKDFHKLLENYRRSLIIYAYQKEWINQNLDTSVSEGEISAYYEANQANFELKENIVQMRFARVPRNAPKLPELERFIQSDDEDSEFAFKQYCLQYALDYNDNDSVWLPFDEVKKKLPTTIEREEDYLKRNRFVVIADSSNFYLLYFVDYKIKSTISPMSFEREKIRHILLNQRKLSLISKMKRGLFESALEKGNAEIYWP